MRRRGFLGVLLAFPAMPLVKAPPLVGVGSMRGITRSSALQHFTFPATAEIVYAFEARQALLRDTVLCGAVK